MFAYWLHSVTSQLNSIRSMIQWMKSKLSGSDYNRADKLLSQYDDICEEIAELFIEINDKEDK